MTTLSEPEALAHIDYSDDHLLGGQLALRQPREGFRVGVDSVLLAAAIEQLPEHALLYDIGCGVGAVGLMLARRFKALRVRGIDIQPELIAMAKHNAISNQLEQRWGGIAADIFSDTLPPLPAADVVVCNPPYYHELEHTPAAAKHHTSRQSAQTLTSWLARCLACVHVDGGAVWMITPAEATLDIDSLPIALKKIEKRPIIAYEGHKPRRIIWHCVRGTSLSSAPINVLPSLILHLAGGAFSPAARRILWDGATIVEARGEHL